MKTKILGIDGFLGQNEKKKAMLGGGGEVAVVMPCRGKRWKANVDGREIYYNTLSV